MKYTFMNGKTVVVPPMLEDAKISRKHMFKARLPITKRQFLEGKGEAVWVTASLETLSELPYLPIGSVFFIKVLEDSCYYPGITYGSVIPVQIILNHGERVVSAILEELYTHQNSPYIPMERKGVSHYHRLESSVI